MEANGWDPPLAYMKKLIDFSNQGTPITQTTLRDIGRKIQFSKGIPEFFSETKDYVRSKFGRKSVALSTYVVSSGFEEIVKSSRIGRLVDDIFGCRFEYQGNDKRIGFPKSSVSFTEKTKFLFAINKGIVSDELYKDPYSVNDYIPNEGRMIPLENMIYIGDGPTDVPCMSLLRTKGCEVFAVYTEPRYGIPKETYELARQGRFTRGPFTRDYSKNSNLRRALEGEIDGYAERIITRMQAVRKSVRHSV